MTEITELNEKIAELQKANEELSLSAIKLMQEKNSLFKQLMEYQTANETNTKAYNDLATQAQGMYEDVKATLSVLAHIKPLILMENVGITEVMSLVNGSFLDEISTFTMQLMTKYNQFTPDEMEIIRKKAEKPQKEESPGMLKNLLSMFSYS